MWKVAWEFVAAKISTKQKIEQDTNGERGQEDSAREGEGKSVFNRINKGRTEPKVNSPQLTPFE